MLKLKVQDMSCGHCASTVQKAVKSFDPAAVVSVDLPSGTVTVESAASAAGIADAIRAAGHPNQPMTA